ncbi:MAG: hypothetical protein J4415_03995 [Candidatus Diapherotrites archaeon]|uniref:PIN domain-containing protein n=1 Tax=Candidatus Iainarchaeum sp. TaxID=3101447 RepID=A0A8T4KYF6_9ARCH|nr:hypothetical protein [Candidatus Diapherotrites archaeon]
MKVTADADILFSALLRKGETRRIWFYPEIEIYAPKSLLEEFKKYTPYLKNKFAGDEKDFLIITEKLISQVSFIEDAELEPFLPAAASLSNDPKDWFYIACALRENTAIWSNDKHFRTQGRIKTMTTQEMMKNFGRL